MNGQLMEYWGRTMLAALQGRNQADLMTSWFQRAFQDITRMNSNLLQIWGIPAVAPPQADLHTQWEQAWGPFLQMQQLSLKWWEELMSQTQCSPQSKKIAQLEEQIEEQAQTIERLQSLIDKSGAGKNEMVDQFQKLIEQQSRQFKQLTASVGDYLKNSAEKAGKLKQTE